MKSEFLHLQNNHEIKTKFYLFKLQKKNGKTGMFILARLRKSIVITHTKFSFLKSDSM